MLRLSKKADYALIAMDCVSCTIDGNELGPRNA